MEHLSLENDSLYPLPPRDLLGWDSAQAWSDSHLILCSLDAAENQTMKDQLGAGSSRLFDTM